MKKLIFSLAVVSIIFASCKPEPPVDYGTIKLDKTSVAMVYDQKIELMPTLSGLVKTKPMPIGEESGNPIVATVESGTGGVWKVRAKRIGETTIKLFAKDMPEINATCSVVVNPRSKIVAGVPKFEKGKSMVDVKNMETGILIDAESSETVLVYKKEPSGTSKVTKLVYQFDSSKKLKSILAVVPYSDENKESMEQYLDERYDKTALGMIGNINYYYAGNATAAEPKQPVGCVAGIFLSNADLGYDLGMKFTDESLLK